MAQKVSESLHRRMRNSDIDKWFKANILDESRLQDYAWKGNVDGLIELLDKGVNIDNMNGGTGMTALHWACCMSHIDAVKLLLKRGARTDIRDFRNRLAIDIVENDQIRSYLNIGIPITDKDLIREEEKNASHNANGACSSSTVNSSQKVFTDKERIELEEKKYMKLHSRSNTSSEDTSLTSLQPSNVGGPLKLKVRIHQGEEIDFNEIELPSDDITFDCLKKVISEEFDVPNDHVLKIRKLPDVVVNKTQHVLKLQHDTRLEVFLKNV